MEDLQQYMQNKLNEFNKNYNAQYQLNSYMDGYIKKQWKLDEKRMHGQWLSVRSISDVQGYITGFLGTIKQYENIRGVHTDAYDMDLALYKAVNAIQKMVQCYDMEDFDFYTFDKRDIDGLFKELYDGVEKMKKVNMHRAMQD